MTYLDCFESVVINSCPIMSYTLILISVSLLLLLLWNYKLIRKFVRPFFLLEKLDGPPKKNLLFGQVGHFYNKSPEEVFKILREWGRKFSLYKICIVPVNAANITTPEDAEKVLSNNKHNDKSPSYWMLQRWLGSGLLLSNGAKWQTRRKILTPTFHFSILKDFLEVFHSETEELVRNLEVQSKIDPIIAINSFVAQFALKSISETAMGVKLTFETKEQREYRKAIHEMGQILLYKMFHPMTILLPIFFMFTDLHGKEQGLLKKLHNFTSNVINERRETSKNLKNKRLALLDLLLQHQKQYKSIDDEGICEEVDTFMFEGHDTTSVLINFALMLIACDEKVQNRIAKEIDNILGGRTPTLTDFRQMKYLDQCIKETLRLYPSVHFVSRTLGEDLITKDGFLLPEGSITHIHIFDLHRNPEIYPDPEKFDPDRFLPENCQKRHPFAYLPFSAGSRNCIGQRFAMLEVKAALCGILRRFILKPVDTPDTIVMRLDLVLRTKDDIRVKFFPRKSLE